MKTKEKKRKTALKISVKKKAKKEKKKRKKLSGNKNHKEKIKAEILSYEKKNISVKKEMNEHLEEFHKRRDWSFVLNGEGEACYIDLASRLVRAFKKRNIPIVQKP